MVIQFAGFVIAAVGSFVSIPQLNPALHSMLSEKVEFVTVSPTLVHTVIHAALFSTRTAAFRLREFQ